MLTPHLGYVSREGLAEMYEQVVEDLAAYLRGRADPRDRVDAVTRDQPLHSAQRRLACASTPTA